MLPGLASPSCLRSGRRGAPSFKRSQALGWCREDCVAYGRPSGTGTRQASEDGLSGPPSYAAVLTESIGIRQGPAVGLGESPAGRATGAARR